MPAQGLHHYDTTTMAGLRGVIISNGIISKAPSAAVIGIIARNGARRRTSPIYWRTWDISWNKASSSII